jgi:hypothetical protein
MILFRIATDCDASIRLCLPRAKRTDKNHAEGIITQSWFLDNIGIGYWILGIGGGMEMGGGRVGCGWRAGQAMGAFGGQVGVEVAGLCRVPICRELTLILSRDTILVRRALEWEI